MRMASPSTLLLALALILIASPAINARHLFTSCLDEKGNFTTNSTYQANLNGLLPSLIDNTSSRAGYFSSFRGKDPDKVYATLLCRGDDVSLVTCRRCLNESVQLLAQYCPNRKASVIWFDECTVRYSDAYFAGAMETRPGFAVWIAGNVTLVEMDTFNGQRSELFETLRDNALSGSGSPRNFATGSINASRYVPLYGLVQCPPDLSGLECNDCLVSAFDFLGDCCSWSPLVYVGLLSCNAVYSVDPFFNSTTNGKTAFLPPPPQSPPPQQLSNDKNVKNSGRSYIIIAILVPFFACLSVLAICLCLCLRMGTTMKKKNDSCFPSEEQSVSDNAQSLQFDFRTIKLATENFSDEKKIGQGGFAAVYKGKLPNGQDIAVKRLINTCMSQNSQIDLEFRNEVQLVAGLQHRNLVRLLGFSLATNERILIYEFMPNSSLDQFIFDSDKRALLDWNLRYKFILGIARGLLYIHEESRLRIIHRDLKAGNILLDPEMNPKIADFGTARLFVDLDRSRDKTKHRVGTFGYMAPEYAGKGEFSVKSDVYSFGVLILEIICGQSVKKFHGGDRGETLPSYAWEIWKDGRAMSLADPKMRADSGQDIRRCVHIGLLCVQEKAADRPTMSAVVLMLNSSSASLKRPSRPAFYVHSRSRSNRRVRTSPLRRNSAPNSGDNVSLITEVTPR